MISPGHDPLTDEGGGPWPALSDLLAASTMIFLVLFAVIAVPALKKAGEADQIRSTLEALEQRVKMGDGYDVQRVGDYLRITVRGDVVFPQNRAALSDMTPAGREKLANLARLLRDSASLSKIDQIHVVGHTSAEGTDAKNWQLSSDRAVAIAQFLIDEGKLPPCRITALGRGRFYPLRPDRVRQGFVIDPEDRRIELELRPVVLSDETQKHRRDECVDSIPLRVAAP